MVNVSCPRSNPRWRAHTLSSRRVSWKDDLGEMLLLLDPDVDVSVSTVEEIKFVVDRRCKSSARALV